MTIPCFQVDAFTDRLFHGNPAAVCLLDASKPAKWMQSVAAENNLSETAFVVPLKTGFGLRWFTPSVEVALGLFSSAPTLWTGDSMPSKRFVSRHKSAPTAALVFISKKNFIEFFER